MEKKIKVLFVSSGNSTNFEIAPFIKSQGESLKEHNIDLNYYAIKQKGLIGYLKNIKPLRKEIKINNYDIIHAHYSLSAFVTLFTFSGKKIVASYMGDDAYGTFNEKGNIVLSSIYLILISLIIQPFLKYIIVKSEDIRNKVINKKKCSIIPNGVNITDIKIKKSEFFLNNNLNSQKKYIVFLGMPDNPRKNYSLAKKAISLLENYYIELINPFPITHEKVFEYLLFSDVLLFTSTKEGSPNVIKEGMMCNIPIVSTNVGDVKWVFGNTEGCYLTSFEPDDVTAKIKMALEFSEKYGRTRGRERIIELGLDSDTIAKSIIEVYKKVLLI